MIFCLKSCLLVSVVVQSYNLVLNTVNWFVCVFDGYRDILFIFRLQFECRGDLWNVTGLHHPVKKKESDTAYKLVQKRLWNTFTIQCKRTSPSLCFSAWLLEETTIFQVFFDDDVGHGVKHKLDVLCVCGTGHVRVDFFYVFPQVQVQKLHFDV